MGTATFPSVEFFEAVAHRVERERESFRRLGFADTTFGVRVLGEGKSPTRTFVLRLDGYSCTTVSEVPADLPPPDGVDFTLEGPLAVWREMLASAGADGHIDAAHTINTLTHHDRPISVGWSDVVGHDRLFRYQESIQLLFDTAARVAQG